MAIYTSILKASSSLRAAISNAAPPASAAWDDRSIANVLKRLAIGTAMAHAVRCSCLMVLVV
jgi:hypothetical protein